MDQLTAAYGARPNNEQFDPTAGNKEQHANVSSKTYNGTSASTSITSCQNRKRSGEARSYASICAINMQAYHASIFLTGSIEKQ
jgi:hypothetical protein